MITDRVFLTTGNIRVNNRLYELGPCNIVGNTIIPTGPKMLEGETEVQRCYVAEKRGYVIQVHLVEYKNRSNRLLPTITSTLVDRDHVARIMPDNIDTSEEDLKRFITEDITASMVEHYKQAAREFGIEVDLTDISAAIMKLAEADKESKNKEIQQEI